MTTEIEEPELKATVAEAEEQGYLHEKSRKDYNNPYDPQERWELRQAFSRGVKRADLEFQAQTEKDVEDMGIQEGSDPENNVDVSPMTPGDIEELKAQARRYGAVVADLRYHVSSLRAERDCFRILIERVVHGCQNKDLDWDFFEQRSTLALNSLKLTHPEVKSDIQDSIVREGSLEFTAEGKSGETWVIKQGGTNYLYINEVEYLKDIEVLGLDKN